MNALQREKRNRIFCKLGLILLVAALCVGAYYHSSVSQASTIMTGTVTASSLNVRSGPSTSYSILGTLSKGTQVVILGESGTWYLIQYNSTTGYVSQSYITDVTTIEVDEEYTQYLIDEGFPEDYAELLSQIHAVYPNWTFEPVFTGLDWSQAVAAESTLGKSLVSSSNNDAQKSTATGAYDWTTNTWYGYDGSSWVCASEEMVAYAMDPRNFLNLTYIFMFESLSYREYQTVEGTENLLSGTFMANEVEDTDGTILNYAQTFVEIGQTLGVSPYHLAARVKQEQGTNGTSGCISGTYSGYEGYFNYFHIRAYASGSYTSVDYGLLYAKSQGWDTRYKSLLGGATSVANNYILKGQDTIYFEKFNVVNEESGIYSHQYMTNIQGAASEAQSLKKGYEDLDQAFVFRIPIYENMPEEPCSIPTGGNPNNWLSALSVSGYSLTPTFQGSVTEYSFIVESDVASITVNATAVASTSTISGTGTYNLSYGTNEIAITCTAQNGDVRTYTLTVARQGEETEEEGGDTGSGTEGGSGDTGSGTEGDSGDTGSGTEGGSGDTGTGGDDTSTIVLGDTNGDGIVNNLDLIRIRKHILGTSTLTDDNFTAADVNGDGSVNNLDLIKVRKHILGTALLQ